MPTRINHAGTNVNILVPLAGSPTFQDTDFAEFPFAISATVKALERVHTAESNWSTTSRRREEDFFECLESLAICTTGRVESTLLRTSAGVAFAFSNKFPLEP